MDKIGSKNYDCRTNLDALSSKDSSSYLFNTTIEKIEESDCLLLVGVNPRKDAAVLNARITKKSFDKNYKIAAIGTDQNLTYKYDNLGNAAESLQELLSGKSDFAKTLKNSKKPMVIFGSDAINNENGAEILNLIKEVADKYDVINKDWNGFNFLSKDTGLINGLELGFDATNTESILKKVKNGDTKLLILMASDDDIKIKPHKDCKILYIGSHGDFGANEADMILPGLAFSEKNDIYINLEGRPQKTKRSIFGPDNTKIDSQIIIELAKECDVDLGFKDQESLESEIFKNHQNIANLGQISSRKWQKSTEDKKKLDPSTEIKVQDYDFHLTNAIARSSNILNKRSQDLIKGE